MGLLKNVFIGLVIVTVLFVGIGFFLPSEFRVERSITIDAPAAQVYPHVSDLKKWKGWGVWFKRDPLMQINYSGPEQAVGMKSSWKSETEGNGEMEVTELITDKKVTYSLYFPDFEMGSTGELSLSETGGKTQVTWVDYGDVGSNPVNHYFAMMMDGMIGPDFEAGLNNLKELVESE